MVDIEKLLGEMRRQRISISEMSACLGIDDSTFYRKLNAGGKSFTLSQADALAKALKLKASEAQSIFFADF